MLCSGMCTVVHVTVLMEDHMLSDDESYQLQVQPMYPLRQCHAALTCRSFDPKMGPIARVLWACLPELLHVGAVLLIVALMVAITGVALFGDRAASFSTFSGVATNLTAA